MVDRHICLNKESGSIETERDVAVSGDPSLLESENKIWLPVSAINALIQCGEQIRCNGNFIHKIEPAGKLTVRCVETDTHEFNTCGLIHHNSVTLRNIIFHCLTHSQDVKIALIDLKYTEFTPYKGVNGVVAVANTVKEAAEIMRIARECMYKRNQEMAGLGINDIKDYKPQNPTPEFMVFNRKFNENDKVEIRLPNGDVRTVTI